MNTYNLVHKPPSNAVVETTYEAYVSVFTKDECLYQGNSEIPILPPPDGCVAILDAELDLVCYAPIEKAMVIAAILNTYKEPT